MFKIGLLIIGLGIFIIVMSSSKYSKNENDSRKVGIAITVFGIVFLATGLDSSGRASFALIGITFGGFMVYAGVEEIKTILKCNQAVDAKLEGFIEKTGRSSIYFPIMNFNYNGRKYKIKSENSMYEGAMKSYQDTEIHTVYINPSDPSQMRYNRKPSIYIYTGFILGLIFLIMGIKVLITGTI